MIKSKNGTILINEEEVKNRLKEYFEELLNRPDPENPVAENEEAIEIIDEADDLDEFTYDEIKNAKHSIHHKEGVVKP